LLRICHKVRSSIIPARPSRRLDYELGRGRTFAAAKNIHAIKKPISVRLPTPIACRQNLAAVTAEAPPLFFSLMAIISGRLEDATGHHSKRLDLDQLVLRFAGAQGQTVIFGRYKETPVRAD
jgi:hypothetical protein